uniref:glutaredoxin family protein n=1 Tax=Nitratifractor sp. TaxID=2268144 RepID=UPI0025E10A70
LYALPAIFAIFFALSDLAIPRNEALITKDGLYLIASDHCPHCRKVKAYFAKKGIRYTKLDVNDPSVRHLAKALGIDEIPILVKRQGGKTTILYGDKPIIASFELAPASENSKSAPLPVTNTDLYSNPDEGGCTLNPLENDGGGCEAPEPEVKLR